MIKSITTFSDLIVYWDLSDCISKDDIYYVYLNNEYILCTVKTHFTIRDIVEKSGSIDVYTDNEKKSLFYHDEYSLSDKPKFIDISCSPYNAVGDGITVNTDAIQKAVNDCGENECVYIPKGTYLTGALNLHSSMELYIEKGGVLLGSADPIDYLPKIRSRFEGLEMESYQSLLNMGNISNRDEICCQDIIIHGGGKICGGGRPLAENVVSIEKERLKEYMDSLGDEINTYENLETIPGRLRPKLINISCSKNIIIDNIEISNGSCWNVHMLYSDNVVTCNCSFCSCNVWNGDGWNPDSSTNCTLFNCDFNTGDDCVAIKSGKNPEGNRIGKPCEKIRIFDCRCTDGHGFTIGSEMSGGVNDVYIWDCDIKKSIFGLEIKATKKRGGYVKNVYVARSRVSRIMMHSVPYNDDGIAADTQPVFSDCMFEDLTICGEAREWGETEIKPCDAIELIGFDSECKIQNIVFKDIVIDNGYSSVRQTLSLQRLNNITISNISVR